MRPPSKGEKRAISVLKRTGFDQLPIAVDEVAKALGAKITYKPFDGDVSGMLYRSDDSPPVIGVNSTHPPTRQRFSIAHEVGHLVMHKGTPVFIDRFARVNWRAGASSAEEVEANAFAAELLMPRELVAREVDAALAKNERTSPDQLSKRLAKSFNVSAQSMGYRLENLGVLDPAALTG